MRRTFIIGGLLLAVAFVATRSPTLLLTLATPRAAGGEATRLGYMPGPRHRMDVYMPAPGLRRPPVVVYFHGGAWRDGRRWDVRYIGRSLAACGVLAIVPDYRVWPATQFPGFLEDAAAAVAAAREEAERRGGDVSRLFLMGYSAGAYIAAMLDLDPVWLQREDLDPRDVISGVIGVAGPYDFLPLRKAKLHDIFAPATAETQPITFAANAHAPMLLMAGAKDQVVDPANSVRLRDSIRAMGGNAREITFANLDHVSIQRALGWPMQLLSPVRGEACRFLNAPSG